MSRRESEKSESESESVEAESESVEAERSIEERVCVWNGEAEERRHFRSLVSLESAALQVFSRAGLTI